MESCPLRATRKTNIAFPSPFFSPSLFILPRQPTALEPPVSKQNLMLLPKKGRMNFRCKKKKEKKLSWKRLSKKEGALSGSCSTMHARWREKFLDEIVCLGRTPSYGVNNIRNKLFLFLVERWIYLRRLCFFDEG